MSCSGNHRCGYDKIEDGVLQQSKKEKNHHFDKSWGNFGEND